MCFNVRPFCKEFLKEMSNYYNIFLFTASSEMYCVEPIVLKQKMVFLLKIWEL